MSVFHLPDLGEGLAEAEIVAWHVQPGDRVTEDQLLVSVETAKAVVDIPSPQAGVIRRLLAEPGQVVPTHAPLVEFADGDEATAPVAAPTREDSGTVVGRMAGEAKTASHETFLLGRRRSDAITAEQVLPRDRRPGAVPAGGDWEPLHGLRRQMAHSMTAARAVALTTLHEEATLTGKKPTQRLLPRLVRALVEACQAEPALNAWFDGDGLRRRLLASVDLGLAVDTPDGLLVAVLPNAGQYEKGELRAALDNLIERARHRALSPAELSGASFSLSSYGGLGGLWSTPQVVPPQVGILGVGRGRETLTAKGKAAVLLPLSLSFDHRAVTGAEAARFLNAVIASLEAE